MMTFQQYLERSKKTLLAESYKIVEGVNDIWFNGSTTLRYDVAANEYLRNTTVSSPKFFTTCYEYAAKYCTMHMNGDKTKGKRESPIVIFIKLKPDANLIDLVDPIDPSTMNASDYQMIGLHPKFRKIFQNCEPYYALNTSPGANIDARSIEYVIATKYLIWWLAFNNHLGVKKAGVDLKTLYNGKISVMNALFKCYDLTHNQNAKIEFDASLYEQFYANYMQQFEGLIRHPVTKHWFKPKRDSQGNVMYKANGEPLGKNADCGDIIDPKDLSQNNIEMIKLYIELFDVLIQYFYSLDLPTNADGSTVDVSNEQLLRDALLKVVDARVNGVGPDRRQPPLDIRFGTNMDPLQVLLQLKIFCGVAPARFGQLNFDGYYCPEKRGASTNNIADDAATVVLFTDDVIQQKWAFSYIDIYNLAHNIFQYDSKKMTYKQFMNVFDSLVHPERKESLVNARKIEIEKEKAERKRLAQEKLEKLANMHKKMLDQKFMRIVCKCTFKNNETSKSETVECAFLSNSRDEFDRNAVDIVNKFVNNSEFELLNISQYKQTTNYNTELEYSSRFTQKPISSDFDYPVIIDGMTNAQIEEEREIFLKQIKYALL